MTVGSQIIPIRFPIRVDVFEFLAAPAFMLLRLAGALAAAIVETEETP